MSPRRYMESGKRFIANGPLGIAWMEAEYAVPEGTVFRVSFSVDEAESYRAEWLKDDVVIDYELGASAAGALRRLMARWPT